VFPLSNSDLRRWGMPLVQDTQLPVHRRDFTVPNYGTGCCEREHDRKHDQRKPG
jgi:hypothetical protein